MMVFALVLLVVAVNERQLLLGVRRIIDGVEVEQQLARRRGEAGDERVDEHLAQPLDGVVDRERDNKVDKHSFFGQDIPSVTTTQ